MIVIFRIKSKSIVERLSAANLLRAAVMGIAKTHHFLLGVKDNPFKRYGTEKCGKYFTKCRLTGE